MTPTILRIYDPPDCDGNGDPLDWECCRACGGDGLPTDLARPVPCATCEGHGSLKAAALHHLTAMVTYGVPTRYPSPAAERMTARCESCFHPMSEGTWTADPVFMSAADRDGFLARVAAIDFAYDTFVHYSPCDEGCRHGGPVRVWFKDDGWLEQDAEWMRQQNQTQAGDLVRGGNQVKASWRQVDIRRMGWPHDLRPERLAVLCTRCYAERTKT